MIIQIVLITAHIKYNKCCVFSFSFPGHPSLLSDYWNLFIPTKNTWYDKKSVSWTSDVDFRVIKCCSLLDHPFRQYFGCVREQWNKGMIESCPKTKAADNTCWSFKAGAGE